MILILYKGLLFFPRNICEKSVSEEKIEILVNLFAFLLVEDQNPSNFLIVEVDTIDSAQGQQKDVEIDLCNSCLL